MEMKRAMTGDQFSGNVHSVGYDPLTRTLAVRFLAKDKSSPGELYHVHAKGGDNSLIVHHAEMMKPDVSTGSYYHKNIKGKYQIVKQ